MGDDVYSQRDKLKAAVETAGPGILVHPSLGSKKVSIVDFAMVERAERGRVVELQFTALETAGSIMPTAVAQTKKGILSAITSAVSAVEADFQTYIAGPLAYGESALAKVTSTVTEFEGVVSSVIGDASAAYNSITGLVGGFGRYFGVGSPAAPAPNTATVSSLLAAQITARTAVLAAASGLSAAGESMTVATASSFAGEAQTLLDAVAAIAQSPADQVRMLTALQAFSPTIPAATSTLGQAGANAQDATAQLLRRSALAALAGACEAYTPTSSTEAMALLDAVIPLFDAEITVAADAGQDGTYSAFRALRAAVATDLIVRGAALPSIETVTTGAPLPALAVAYLLYQDATRSDQLIARANPAHPAFMPTSFEALSA